MKTNIFGLIISVGLIIAGLSGQLVLKGTDSGAALVGFGVILLAWDIIAIVRHRQKQRRKE
jgi:threonine/homoserine efflux transporter RhtA